MVELHAHNGSHTNHYLSSDGEGMSEKRTTLKKQLIDLEYQAESIKARVKDIEWMIEMGEENSEQSFSDRRKALDKLKFIHREVAEIKMRLLDE